MHVDDLRSLSIFTGLTDDQLAELLAGGTEIAIEPGAELFHEGDHADFWWVLVDGAIDLVRRVGREDTVVARMDLPGRWAGGFRAWDTDGTYLATGRGALPGRVLRVPAELLRDRADAWFPFAGHLIRGLYHTARSIESTVRQRDSLVTLGTLAAGLAHEINNPASAASSAVDALETSSQTLLSALRRLSSNEITATQFNALDALRLELSSRTTETDPLALADREQELTRCLRRHGMVGGHRVTTALAAAGADPDWCERLGVLLPGAALEPGLEWVASTVAVASLVSEVKESTRRISELVAAVRSYSQLDRASVQRIAVTEGLDSTLTILGHLLHGVEVIRDYDPGVPLIEAYPGELNQVWTNLITNALDAMGGTGTLHVATRLDGETVVVEITDSGSGMTPDVAARAFEAFYTTKDVGRGTGLGLDIARRIVVERHGGMITIDSEPGRTVLQVSLPVHRATR